MDAQDSLEAGNMQLKVTSRECKCKKEEREQKQTEITEKKLIVKCDKLVVYDGTNESVESDDTTGDLYLPMCTMATTQGYTCVQTARRGTPFRPGPRGRGTRGRQLGNLKNLPSYI